MTKLFTIGICFIFLYQTYNYHFNYKLTYEYTILKKKDKSRLVTFLINDQDNSYYSSCNAISGNKTEITLLDQNGPYWKGQKYGQILNSSEIMLEKELLRHYSNPFKYQVDDYDFVALEDTLLNDKICKRYLLKSTNAKKEQKKKLAREVYVIDTTSNMKPWLPFSTAYEIYKKRRNIPNGIIVEKYLYDFKGEMETTMKLKKMEGVSVKFMLPQK